LIIVRGPMIGAVRRDFSAPRERRRRRVFRHLLAERFPFLKLCGRSSLIRFCMPSLARRRLLLSAARRQAGRLPAGSKGSRQVHTIGTRKNFKLGLTRHEAELVLLADQAKIISFEAI